MTAAPSLHRRLARLMPAIVLAAAAACATSAGTAGGGAGAVGGGAQAGPRASVSAAPRGDWIQLFNGRDMSNWDIKFAKHPLGENYNDTFRVDSGMLKVRYDKWTAFDGKFGHIFYKQPFSHYLVAVEYRFVGGQVTGAGPSLAWAIRNNGIMLHGQSAQSMALNQDFPISLEVQLLGGYGRPRTTANLCTPGTHVYFGDSLITRHCNNSTSKTYEGDRWVRVEVLALGDSIFKHIVEGDTVLTYRRPIMGGGSGTTPGTYVEGKAISGGTISLQAETAEIDFRKVELLNLRGCMDPRSPRYKPYFVSSDPTACR